MTDTSRRAFLRGAAALPVAVATGGGSVVAATSVLGGVAQAGAVAGALSAVERKARAAIALAKAGGFPARQIAYVLGGGYYKQGGPQHINIVEHLQKAHQEAMSVVLGDGEFQRTPFNPEGPNRNAGKISFASEHRIAGILRTLPRDVPLLDIINSEMYNDTRSKTVGRRDEVYGWKGNFEVEDVEIFRRMIEPYCSADTTVDDLLAKADGYFMRLADHFLKKPSDFAGRYEDGWNIGRMLEEYITKEADTAISDTEKKKLSDALMAKANHYKDRYDLKEQRRRRIASEKNREAEEIRQNSNELKRQEQEQAQIADQEHRRNNPGARKRFSVVLYGGERGEYILDRQGHAIQKPLRADWHQLAQEIDPEGARPGDIEIRCGGLMVAFHNPKIAEAIKSNPDEKQAGYYRVSLPNRRMGVDLNDPAADMP